MSAHEASHDAGRRQLGESLVALSTYFVGARSMEETLQHVSDLTSSAIPAAAVVGITMMADGRPQTAVFTDPEAPEIDRTQYETGQGPCLRSFIEGTVIGIDDMGTETRWPPFVETCLQHGIGSTLSVPLNVEGETHGALNLYARRPHAFGREELELTSLFAAQAAIALANARAYWDARTLSEQLRDALGSRSVIEQAKGIIMATVGCSAEDAFEHLRRQSQHENRKLRVVAEELVQRSATRRGGPPPA